MVVTCTIYIWTWKPTATSISSKVGTHNYVNHASFRVLCVAWKVDGRPAVGSIVPDNRLPPDLRIALQAPEVQGHAFNAAFETAVLTRLGIASAHPLSCTMQRALAYGLPGKLEAAAAALGFTPPEGHAGPSVNVKDHEPLKPGSKTVWEAADYDALTNYCIKDVEAEAALSAVIPELQPEERELALLDISMNTDGELGIDFDQVTALQAIARDAEKQDAARCAVLTGGAVTSPGTQTARLLAWLATQGVDLPDASRATVEDALANISPATATVFGSEVLQIRLARGPGLDPQAGADARHGRPGHRVPCGVNSSSAGQDEPAAGRAGAYKCKIFPEFPKIFRS